MARKPPRPHVRGTPKTPGSGRRKGTPNRRSLAAKELCSALVLDPQYHHKLRLDFIKRRVHPSVESLIWAYHLGKPRESIEMSGGLTFNKSLEAERKLLQQLDLRELEALAEQSQALLDRAFETARARLGAGAVIDVPSTHPTASVDATGSVPVDTETGDGFGGTASILRIDVERDRRKSAGKLDEIQ